MSRKAYVRPAGAVKCRREQIGSVANKQVDFSIWDERGRRTGVSIRTYVLDYTAKDPADGSWGYIQVPGRYYVCDVQATRDSVRYGASQADSYHATQAEADEEGAKRAEATRKRYQKKYVG